MERVIGSGTVLVLCVTPLPPEISLPKNVIPVAPVILTVTELPPTQLIGPPRTFPVHCSELKGAEQTTSVVELELPPPKMIADSGPLLWNVMKISPTPPTPEELLALVVIRLLKLKANVLVPSVVAIAEKLNGT